ncbi:hypothetical protein LguiA_007679 [Lonicera macranthoides]
MATIIFVLGVLWRKLGHGARQEFLCCTILFSHYWGLGFLRYFQLKQLPNFLLAFPILSLAVCSIIYYAKLRREVFLSLGFRASPVDKKSAAVFFSVGTESRSKSESVLEKETTKIRGGPTNHHAHRGAPGRSPMKGSRWRWPAASQWFQLGSYRQALLSTGSPPT